MNRSFQAQYRANRFHKPTQTIGVKIMNVKKIRAQVAQLNEGKIVSLVNNSSLLLSVKGIKTDADRRIVKGLLLNRLTKIRAASAAMADNTVHQRINRSYMLRKQDQVTAKAVSLLIKTAKEGGNVTVASLMEVETKLGLQLSVGQLKAIFFAFQNEGHFQAALDFASSIGEAFCLEVSSSIRWMEKQIFGGLMIKLGVVAKAGISKFVGIIAKAFAAATTA